MLMMTNNREKVIVCPAISVVVIVGFVLLASSCVSPEEITTLEERVAALEDPMDDWEGTAIEFVCGGQYVPDAEVTMQGSVVQGELDLHVSFHNNTHGYRDCGDYMFVPEIQPRLDLANITVGTGGIYRGDKAYWVVGMSSWKKAPDDRWGVVIIIDNECTQCDHVWGQKIFADKYPFTVGGGTAAVIHIQIPGR